MLKASWIGLGVCVFVCAVVVAAEPEADTPKTGNPVEVALDQLRAMKPAEQQAWLKRLEARAVRAARLKFKPDVAAEKKTAIYDELHRKTVTWTVLRELITDTNTWEKDAIRRLTTQYQQLVFETFHKQMDVYNERQQAWISVKLGWELAGSQFNQQDLLIDWLQQAILAAAPDAIAPIPPKPEFEKAELEEDSPTAPFETPNKPKSYDPEPGKSQTSTESFDTKDLAKDDASISFLARVPSPKRSVARIRLQRYDRAKNAAPDLGTESAEEYAQFPRQELSVLTVSQPKMPRPEEAATPVIAKPKPIERTIEKPVDKLAQKPAERPTPKPVEKPVVKPAEPPVAKPVEHLAEQKPVFPVEKLVEKPTEKTTPKPEVKPLDKPVVKTTEQPATTLVEKPVAKAPQQPATTLADKPVVKVAEQPVAKPVETPVEKVAAKRVEKPTPRLVKKPEALLTEKPVVKLEEKLAEKPVPKTITPPTPPAEKVAPQELAPRIEPKTPAPVVERETPRPPVEVASRTPIVPMPKPKAVPQPEPSSDNAIEVETDELTARISGYNLALRGLETELDAKERWTADDLEPMIERLRILSLRRHDLQLFRDTLTEEQRKLVDPLATTKSVLSQMTAMLAASKKFAKSDKFRGADSERQVELRHLDELASRLSKITAE
jgi:hypothetical protein